MRMLYKYPQAAFPYDQLVAENRRRGKDQPEFELWIRECSRKIDTSDVFVEYAKADVEDILIRITAVNRGRTPRHCICCPLCGFAIPGRGVGMDGVLRRESWRARQGAFVSSCSTGSMGPLADLRRQPELLFTENETNRRRLNDGRSFVREGRLSRICDSGNKAAVNLSRWERRWPRCIVRSWLRANR